MQLLLFIGPPGSGKGTQAQRLAQELKYEHLVTGDLLRHEVHACTPLGQQIRPLLEAGLLIPDELVINLISRHLSNNKNYILDGFPRTIAQARALDEMLQQKNASIRAVLALEVPEDEILARLLKRSQLEGRTDDNPETIRRRLNEYHAKTTPLIEFYEARGLLKRIPGTGPIPQITEHIRKALEKC